MDTYDLKEGGFAQLFDFWWLIRSCYK